MNRSLYFLCLTCIFLGILMDTRAKESKPSETCKTLDTEKPCYFPFKYNKDTYTTCTKVGGNGNYWCPTKTDDDDNYLEYGICKPDCVDKKKDKSCETYAGLPCLKEFELYGKKYKNNKCPYHETMKDYVCVVDKDTQALGVCNKNNKNCKPQTKEKGVCKATNGKKCLKFKYSGTDYKINECTKKDGIVPWCATETNDKDEYVKYGYCNKNCKVKD